MDGCHNFHIGRWTAVLIYTFRDHPLLAEGHLFIREHRYTAQCRLRKRGSELDPVFTSHFGHLQYESHALPPCRGCNIIGRDSPLYIFRTVPVVAPAVS